MLSTKAEFEEKITTKGNKLKKLAKEYLQCLQSINALFKFQIGWLVKLTKHGCSIFAKLGFSKK